jgi:hypothetical protein
MGYEIHFLLHHVNFLSSLLAACNTCSCSISNHFVVRTTTSELECTILTTLYFASAENTDSWGARKGICIMLFLWTF